MSTRRPIRVQTTTSPSKSRFPGAFSSPLPSPFFTPQPHLDAARAHAEALLRPLHTSEKDTLTTLHNLQTEELKSLLLPAVRKHADNYIGKYNRSAGKRAFEEGSFEAQVVGWKNWGENVVAWLYFVGGLILLFGAVVVLIGFGSWVLGLF